MASQPQSYGSIREFLDNLPNQPCVWQPENANICVTCLRINEPVARVCSVWAQALEEAPLEEIDFEEEVRSLPSVVEIEDDFEIVESVTPVLGGSTVAEVDIVEASSDWNMIAEPIVETPTEEIIEEALEIEEVVEATEDVADPVVAESMSVEATEYVAEATEDVALDTIQDAVDADAIAQEKVESASEAEEITAEAVVEAVNTEAEAVEAYADAVKEEAQAAEAVVEAVEAENVATEAVIEAAEQVTELIEKEADESDIQEAVTELEDSVEKQEEAEVILTEAVTVEETAADEVETTSTIEEEAAEELEKAIVADEKASDDLEEAISQEEKAEEEVKETIEASKELVTDDEPSSDDKEPFIEGNNVTHGVYGNGTVLQATKAGKHWSVEVDFEEGKRRILGTFLTLNEDKTTKPEPSEESFKKPESEKKSDEAEEEVKETIEASKELVTDDESNPEDKEPFIEGDNVIHSVYGNGTVLQATKAGKHWSIEVDFEEGKRKILGTSLTLNEDKTGKPEPAEESFKRPESEKKSEEAEEEDIAKIVADVVPVDYGAYNPGTKVTHGIFGKGEVKDSKPKGDNYRLEIEFEDGSVRKLLSTFVDIFDEAVEATEEATEAVVVEAETTEPIEAKPVVAEAAALDTDVVYRRPKKKEKEAILDLSKPEVQDAEMVDDDD